ncbi:pirin family protein [Thalassobaculum sp. OXR-137]|uniref:pirin family protein n=1 Tax=Thalassobaculum sp. OXR-137 TaxID=3100173 RepID=UPI002AC8A9BE|nr:pirin family protein [Thalassobaculum sp. OXR-137]WPZ36953.1 pirin family protein [Thalassobaculum sp. OXR-137]
MIEVRPFDSLGKFRIDWLNASHHFSFGHYMNPKRMGFGALRVWNDDTIEPGTGFDPHPHRDMEIITYVRKGAITHQDRLGNQGRTEAGDVQVMSAGTGIVHAEYNQEPDQTQIFQIWIEPSGRGFEPRWDARQFPKGDRSGDLVVLASGRAQDAGNGALSINQDAAVLGATVKAGQSVTHILGAGRKAYLVAAAGAVEVNGVAAKARDGVAIADEETVTITATEDAEIVLVDVP